MIFTTVFFSTVLALVSTTTSAPPITAPHSLIVFSPHITSPKESVTWPMGSTHNITWETFDIPSEKQNSTGLILLGHSGNNSENLDIEHPLATGFSIVAGSVPITMPKNLAPRNDYFVVLFGDSGNKSPHFNICR